MKRKIQLVVFGVIVLIVTLSGLYWLSLAILFVFLIGLLFRSKLSVFVWIRKHSFVSSLISIVGIFLLAISMRVFFVEIFAIPSGSMEETLLVGDKILVNKLDYGPRLPYSPYEIPWINLFWFLKANAATNTDTIYWNYSRLRGYSKIRNGDVLVFGHPLWGKRDNYFIKRCIGIAGDTLVIKQGNIMINGKAFIEAGHVRKDFVISNNWARPERSNFNWTINDYGPITIPYKGMKIELNRTNYMKYWQTIEQLEKVKFEEREGQYFMDNQAATHYTFKSNYYFMMGDNRNNSNDSRYWGFVPEENVVGKAVVILFSNNDNGVQWQRIFNPIN